jgi:hypothetical protein
VQSVIFILGGVVHKKEKRMEKASKALRRYGLIIRLYLKVGYTVQAYACVRSWESGWPN